MSEQNARDRILGELKRQGCNIIPIPPRQKFPSMDWKKYQTERYLPSIPDGMNFAVICGEISDNLLVIDIDHKGDDPGIINEIIPDVLKKTLVVQTGTHGHHIYLKVRKLPNSTKLQHQERLVKGKPMGIDIQANGKIVVGPGSIHPNGSEYTIASDTREIMEANFLEIGHKLESLGFTMGAMMKGHAKELAKGVKSGSRHQAAIQYGNLVCGTLNDEKSFRFEMDRWNKQNDPPLPETELEKIIIDILGHQSRKREAIGDEVEDGDKRNVDDISELMMGRYRIRTAKDNDQMFIFNGAVYEPTGAEATIREECEQEKKGCTTRFVSEVIAKVQRRTYIDRAAFDSDPNILTCNNGILNINTMSIMDHTPANLSTVQLPVFLDKNHDPGIPLDDLTVSEVDKALNGTKFYKYLTECFTIDGVTDDIQIYTVLEMMASCLLKTNKFQKAFMMIGSGANGKSVLLNFLTFMLGKENCANISIQSLANERFSMAELYGKLANIYADIEATELHSTGKLKVLIGDDAIMAERKNRAPFSFKNYSKQIFSANKFPQVNDPSDGWFRRFIIINWKRQFGPSERNSNLLNELCVKEETKPVFKLLVQMANRLNHRGRFLKEQSTSELRKEWMKHSDPIQMFVDEMVVESENDEEEEMFVTKKNAYRNYKTFCGMRELEPVKLRIFSQAMSEYYDESTKKVNGIATRIWAGIRIKDIFSQETLEDFDA